MYILNRYCEITFIRLVPIFVVSVVGRSTKLRIQWTKTTVKMNNLISTFHFRLHNSTAHLSNVLELSRRLVIKWSLLCWKYKIHEFYFGRKHKTHESTIPRTCSCYLNHTNWYPWRKVLSPLLAYMKNVIRRRYFIILYVFSERWQQNNTTPLVWFWLPCILSCYFS
jgi:hypothetical protein